ncbi:MAG: glycosyltransferase, partial [Thermomicrobia bacterium]|nr:glycosyltransferase [Thermomicrobia bacterium]
GVELTVIVPPAWVEPRVGVQKLDAQFTQGYDLIVTEMRFNGHFHYHYYPAIGKIIRDLKPDVFHIDEEPYNYATYHAMKAGQRAGARMCFFTYQNIMKRYPFPFSSFEKAIYAGVDVGVAANQAALDVIRAKGFTKPSFVIPQFGVDPALYQSGPPTARPANRPPTVGYIGRLVEEKGVQVLLDAVASLRQPYRLEIIGSGYYRTELEVQAARLGIRDRIFFRNSVPSRDVPNVLSKIDMLVVPSLTRSNWKEQFGRVIIEAMACEVPVIGSDSGEIPNVIGDAGIIVPEGDAETLALRIWELMEDRVRRLELAARGRQRVLRYFTQQQVALRYYQLYQAMLYGNVPYEPAPPPPVFVAPSGYQLPTQGSPRGQNGAAPEGDRPAAASGPMSAPSRSEASRPSAASESSAREDEPAYPPGYGDAPAPPPPAEHAAFVWPPPERVPDAEPQSAPAWWPSSSLRPPKPPEQPWWLTDHRDDEQSPDRRAH